MIRKIASHWPLALLLTFSFLIRIYKLQALFYFTYDEEIPAFVGRRLMLWHHIPLIGGVTPFHFHLGPYFYWFYSFLLFFSKLDPLIWGYAGAAMGIGTTFLVFKLSKEIGGKRLAFTAATFWTFSTLANLYDRHLWALYWGPLISLITIYSINKIIQGKNKFIYLLGFTLALSIHADLSNLIFYGLTLVAWLIFKFPRKRHFIIAFCFIPLLILPLIIFDIRHNFANTQHIADYLSDSKNIKSTSAINERFINSSLIFPKAFTRLVYKFGDDEVAKQYSYCSAFIGEKYKAIPPIVLFLSLIILTAFAFNAFRKKESTVEKLMAITLILYFLALNLYGTIMRGDVFEHYITGLFPLFIIIFAFFVSKLPRYVWIAVIALFVICNLYKLSQARNSHGLIYKKEAILFTEEAVGRNDFSLESLSTCWRYSGYRYLFAAYGREPTKSFVDPNLSYLYGGTPVADKNPPIVTTFVTHDFLGETDDFYKKYGLYKSHEIKNAIFGNIEVIIMDNSTGWF